MPRCGTADLGEEKMSEKETSSAVCGVINNISFIDNRCCCSCTLGFTNSYGGVVQGEERLVSTV